jgi:hypothetical protein
MSDIEARLKRLEDYIDRVRDQCRQLDDRIGKAEQDLKVVGFGRPS